MVEVAAEADNLWVVARADFAVAMEESIVVGSKHDTVLSVEILYGANDSEALLERIC